VRPTSPFAGRYTINEELGRGGTAVVYKVYDEKLQVPRALKLLSATLRRHTGMRRRLRSEAQAMAALDHPHLLRVYDIGEEGGQDYVIMALAEGGSLADIIDEHGPLSAHDAVAYTLQLLAGLERAHAANIVHRDIKPQNLLRQGGVVMIADFGIALFDRENVERQTAVGAVMGSLAYMAPEQRLDARSVDHRADLYAAGATLFVLLTNNSPFDLFLAAPDSPRWEGIPEQLRPIIRHAMGPNPEDRYQSAREMSRDLLPFLARYTSTPSPHSPDLNATAAATRDIDVSLPVPTRQAIPPRTAPSAPSRSRTPTRALPGEPVPAPTAVPFDVTRYDEDPDERPTISPNTVRKPPQRERAALGLLAAGILAVGAGAWQLNRPALDSALHAAIVPDFALAESDLPARYARVAAATVSSAQALLDRPAPSSARRARPPSSCSAYPIGAGSSPVSGTWRGQVTIPLGNTNQSALARLHIGGDPSALAGCSLVKVFDQNEVALPLRGALAGSTLTLTEDGSVTYTLSLNGNTLTGSQSLNGSTLPVRFTRVL